MERADLEQWKAREVARLLALVETERRYYQDIIAALPVGLLVLSKDLSILSANRSVKRIFGLRTGDSLRGRLDSLLPSWLLDRVEQVLRTGTAEMGIPLVTDSPQGRHLHISIQAIHDWEESPGQEALLTIEDVTELTESRSFAAPAVAAAPVVIHEPLPIPAPAEPQPVHEAEQQAEAAPLPELEHGITLHETTAQETTAHEAHETLLDEHVAPETPAAPVAEEPTPEPPAPVAVPEPKIEVPDASLLFENLRAAIWALDLDSQKLIFANKEARLLFGDEPWQHIHPDDRVSTLKLYHAAIENPDVHDESLTCEYRALSAGSPVWIRETARILPGEDGHARYLVGVSIDATERHLLERQAVQSERVDAVSKLSSRLAHDLNNMLMIVTGYAEELAHSIPKTSPMQADVQEIRTGTGRITALTHQLLDFTRLKASDPEPMEINAYLNQLKAKVQEIVGSTLLEWNLHPERIGAKAESSELEQVLESLLVRARQVSGQQGLVSIATEPRSIRQSLTRPGSSLRPGSYAVISIADQGDGVDEEARATLFESFLSSPAIAQAYTIVRQWGGDIAIAEANHLGSTIDIYLPAVTLPPAPKAEVHETPAPESTVAEHAGDAAVEHVEDVHHAGDAEVEPHPVHAEAAPVAPPAPVPPAVPPPPPAQTVLLVEDESGIRALVRKILRRQGYEVIEAESGEQALELARQFSGRIDLIVTDLMLPKIGGRELVAELQKEGHTMKVLYVSGYTDDPAVYAEQLPAGTAYLQKPFTLGSLLDKVKDVLGPQV